MNWIDLFPTSILNEEIKDDKLSLYKEFILKSKLHDFKRDGYYTEEQDILDVPLFSSLKEIIIQKSLFYLNEIGHGIKNVSIINSWGNNIKKDQHIPMHDHCNSYLSGCFYITGGSSIEFHNPLLEKYLFQLDWFNYADNPRAYKNFHLNPFPGLLLIWPSWLNHKVTTSTEDIDRISLAFNVMPKGLIGRKTGQINL